MASNQRRTDDLLRLKTRGLIYQNADGTYPILGSVPHVTSDTSGNVGFSGVTIDASNNVIVPGNLTVEGTTNINIQIQDLILSGACPAVSSATTLSLLPGSGNVGINKCTPTVALDVSGAIAVSGELTVANLFHVNNSFVDISGNPADTKIASGINMNTDTAQLRLYAQNNPYVPGKREGTIGLALPSSLGGFWQTPTITFDLSSNSLQFQPHLAGYNGPMIYDNQGNLSVAGIVDINTSTTTYTTPGIYTFQVPPNTPTLDFEILGAGGYSQTTQGQFPAVGGTGGYITGTMTVGTSTTLTIQVGSLQYLAPPYQGLRTASSASYISNTATGLPFIVAAAGGSGNSASGAPNNGGFGGGGIFTNNVANGGNGGGASGGAGGTTTGGAGGSVPGFTAPAGANPAGNIAALGGNGDVGAGGGGYAGGGGGVDGGGGGGSSYVSSGIIVSSSYPGNTLPTTILPGYGRSDQSGYVRITVPKVSLITDGDIQCGGNVTGNLFINPTKANVYDIYTTNGAQNIAPGNVTASGTYITWASTSETGSILGTFNSSYNIWTCKIPGVYIINTLLDVSGNAGLVGAGVFYNLALVQPPSLLQNTINVTLSASYTKYLSIGDTIIIAGLETTYATQSFTVQSNSTLTFTRIC